MKRNINNRDTKLPITFFFHPIIQWYNESLTIIRKKNKNGNGKLQNLKQIRIYFRNQIDFTVGQFRPTNGHLTRTQYYEITIASDYTIIQSSYELKQLTRWL